MYEHVKARPGGRRQPMLRAEGPGSKIRSETIAGCSKGFQIERRESWKELYQLALQYFVGFSVESELEVFYGVVCEDTVIRLSTR